MTEAYSCKLKGKEDREAAARALLSRALERGLVDAVLVPAEDRGGAGLAYMLATEPEHMGRARPMPPAVPQFGPQNLVSLSEPGGGPMRVAAVLRPCEARAVVELAKLRQVDLGGVVLVSPDCEGTVELKDAARAARGGKVPTRRACEICRTRVAPPSVDLAMGTLGVPDGELLLVAHTEAGAELAKGVGCERLDMPRARVKAVEQALSEGLAAYTRAEAEARERYSGHGPFLRELMTCIKCMNCMEVCPVCYCAECLFKTEAFDPSAPKLADKAKRRGVLRVPTETVQFHLTRMAHVMTACVMCGQCESACPSGIPLLSMYAGVNRRVQELFGYEAGRDREEAPPFTQFREDEEFA